MSEKTENFVSIDKIWAKEWDVIYRPDRLKYVRRLVKPKNCVFCDVKKEKDLLLFEGKKGSILLNKYPYNTGHLLVISKTHCGVLEDLEEGEFEGVHKLIKEAISVLKKEYNPEGFNVGLNLGKVAGSSIPEHLHWHVIPRWFGDTNFFPLVCETKVLPETLEAVFERLKKHF